MFLIHLTMIYSGTFYGCVTGNVVEKYCASLCLECMFELVRYFTCSIGWQDPDLCCDSDGNVRTRVPEQLDCICN